MSEWRLKLVRSALKQQLIDKCWNWICKFKTNTQDVTSVLSDFLFSPKIQSMITIIWQGGAWLTSNWIQAMDVRWRGPVAQLNGMQNEALTGLLCLPSGEALIEATAVSSNIQNMQNNLPFVVSTILTTEIFLPRLVSSFRNCFYIAILTIFSCQCNSRSQQLSCVITGSLFHDKHSLLFSGSS